MLEGTDNMPLSCRSLIVVVAISLLGTFSPAAAETINNALAKAYRNNSSLNSARAGVRATDESIAIAKSGFRPTIAGTGTINHTEQSGIGITTGSFGVSIRQPIFDGFQARNNVRAAEARVRAAMESLRNTEQNILFNAAAAYMDVIRDRAIAALREQNVEFLTEQVRAARARLEVGEGTRTDVAQAEASRAAAIAQVSAARARARASAALYRQIVGEEPGRLETPSPVRIGLPPSLDQGIMIAITEHPAVRASLHLVDAAVFAVKASEGAMLPQISAEAGVSSSFRDIQGLPGVGIGVGSEGTTNSASIGATLTVPIYQGGRVSAQVRQGKEELGQARIDVDVARDEVRQALTAAWLQYEAARETVAATGEVVNAAQLALQGVIEERNVGQRTTLDVLNAQADVIDARINLITAQRDVVVASYAILSAAGRLSVQKLGLDVPAYDPEEHYRAVKDKWYGTRTPDGR
jgi:outer membrane protein